MDPDVQAAVTALAEEDKGPPIPAAPASTVPLREDQVENAVAFLSHPKVRGSSTASKRAFLENKGLTAAEIDEGFRRTPAAPLQAEPAPAPAAQSFSTATTDALQAATPVQQQALQPRPPTPEPIRWTQVVAGAGALGVGVWVIHQFLLPPVFRWWRGPDKPSPESAAALAVANALQEQTAEVRATLESMKLMIAELKEPSRRQDAVSLTDLRHELRSLATSLEAGKESSVTTGAVSGLLRDVGELKALMATSAAGNGNGSNGFASPDTPAFARPHPAANGHAYGNGEATKASSTFRPASPTPSATPSQPSHPASYMEVLEMLERGETPPNVRDDINDSAPNPEQAASQARMKPRAKPWERAHTGAASSVASSNDGDGKSSRITELETVPGPSTSSDGAAWKPPAVPSRSIFAQEQ
ncbi:hypothetical protein WJX73_005393 [Symbiochloris irregularis]|uniref:Peroxisomal membrane protein PEX14 n=1 Tax=Symbiochloris irregularis TaxID=706552 RepID=A0AAW1NVH7_9CHLO